MKFLKRSLLEATSNSFGRFSLSVMISEKKNLIKWSCSVCIGICFYVYMVYSFDGMFKLYCVHSLYSMHMFFLMCINWMKWYQKIVCFSDENFTKLRKSCLAILKGHPGTVCTTGKILILHRWHCCTCCLLPWYLPVALQSLASPCWGGPQEWARRWNKSVYAILCCAPTMRGIGGSVHKINYYSWIHHFFHLLKCFNLLR